MGINVQWGHVCNGDKHVTGVDYACNGDGEIMVTIMQKENGVQWVCNGDKHAMGKPCNGENTKTKNGIEIVSQTLSS